MSFIWGGFPKHLLISTALISAAFAQEARRLADLSLEQLAEIPIVSAARHEQSRAGSPRSVSVITAEEIRRRNYRNVPEAVANVAGVYLQQTNYGGGSPIIRGMVGNRILLMLNGVRLNNSTYRLGPNQYLNLIDIDQVDRIEVVRGAGSVLYGSDAFGGVINVITRAAPERSAAGELSTSMRVRFGTANTSGTGRIELSGAKGPLGFVGGFSQEQFGDLTAGAGRGLQPNTGYHQSAGDLTVTAAMGTGKTLTAMLSRLKQFDVDRTDILQAGTDTEHNWNPQGRDQFTLRYRQNDLSHYVNELQATISFGRPFEYLTRIQASSPSIERKYSDVTSTSTVGLQLTSAIGTAHVLTYGLEATSDRVASSRMDVDLRSGKATSGAGNYVDGSRFESAALFLQDEVRVTSRFDAVFGARYDRFRIRAESKDPAFGSFKMDSSPAAVNGSAHALYRLNRNFSAVAGVSQGFRAPNIDDSTVLGGSGSRFEIPNDLLKPERSTNVEYGIRLQGRTGNMSLVTFRDRYHDLIDRVPSLLNGLPFLDRNNNGIKDGAEEAIYQRRNINRATVCGVEFEAMMNVADGWTWSNYMTWTRGTDVSLGQPLTRIPPLNGASRLTWQSKRAIWIEGALLAATGQRRLAPADKTDIRIGPDGTAGYAVVHLRAGLRRSFLSGLSVALENLTNRRYRFHGSGIDRPGINLVVGYGRAF